MKRNGLGFQETHRVVTKRVGFGSPINAGQLEMAVGIPVDAVLDSDSCEALGPLAAGIITKRESNFEADKKERKAFVGQGGGSDHRGRPGF